MQHARLTPDYAVAPQFAATDMPAVKAAGFTTVICNRPDDEVPSSFGSAAMRAAAEAEGLTFVVNPVESGDLGLQQADAQRAAVEAATGPVLAYCRSGTRSSIVWAIAMAKTLGVDEVIVAAGRGGYQLGQLRPVLEEAARG